MGFSQLPLSLFLSEGLSPGLSSSKGAHFQSSSTPDSTPKLDNATSYPGVFVSLAKLTPLPCPDASVTSEQGCFLRRAHPNFPTSAIILHALPHRPQTLTEREEVEMIRPPRV